MHNFLGGKFSKEFAAFTFLGIRYGVFTLEALNERLTFVKAEDGARLRKIRATDVEDGQDGDLPKSGCSMSWTAGDILHFIPVCNGLYRPNSEA